MERWDLVQSTSEAEDSSWIEAFADETLGESDANERFLGQVLSPSTKARRDFRGSLRKLVSQHQDAPVTEISRALGYLVAWPLSSAVRVGDVGSFTSDISFARLTSLSALGVDIPGEAADRTLADVNYTIGDVSTVVTDQVIHLEFARPGGVFFLASGLRSRRIDDLPRLSRQILALVDAGQWQEDWNVVTEATEAELVLFFVADEEGASVELLGGPRSLVPEWADGTPRLVRNNGIRICYVAGPGTTPLFKAARVRRRLFSPVATFS
ncbi:MAG: hypothetical protein ACRDPY_41200 [Streptosporangiaceae bacterium]